MSIIQLKTIVLLSALCFHSWGLFSQPENSTYDQALADSLGGDEYGMKSYYLCILKTGSNTTKDSVLLDSLFAGHMQNIGKLAKEGLLIVAGPLHKNDKNYRGIFILNTAKREEAEAMVMTDPAVRAKLFDVELYQWYGSAALPEYLKVHEKIQRTKM